MGNSNKIAWFVFAILAIGVGLYPLMYAVSLGENVGLLTNKPPEVLSNSVWKMGFYGHILFGGLALLTGWSQFSKKLRAKKINLHRNLGKMYVASALISGICGVYLGFYATGGWISSLGFILLGLLWIYTTYSAYRAIRKKDRRLHQGMMIYSYAACFAAVTLRFWLLVLSLVIGDYIIAFTITAWLCWVPNMFFARYWIKRRGLILG